MPIVCIERKNRKRPRTFTAKDCGRIVCTAVSDGVSKDEISKEIGKCLEKDEECQKELAKARAIANAAMGLFAVFTIFIPQLRAIRRTLSVFELVFPSQARQIQGIIEDALVQAEKTQRIIDDIVRGAAKPVGASVV